MTTNYAEFKTLLTDRLEALRKRIAEAEATLDQPADPDIEEQASNRQGDEVLEGIENAALAEIRAVTAALGRLEAGRYGACIACGERISAARLRTLPHTEHCRQCA